MTPAVWNKRDPNTPKGAVYVGRPSKWGNPFKIGRDVNGTIWNREQVIDLFATWCERHPEFRQEIREELKGKHLVCWCAPRRCHADILLEIANS